MFSVRVCRILHKMQTKAKIDDMLMILNGYIRHITPLMAITMLP